MILRKYSHVHRPCSFACDMSSDTMLAVAGKQERTQQQLCVHFAAFLPDTQRGRDVCAYPQAVAKCLARYYHCRSCTNGPCRESVLDPCRIAARSTSFASSVRMFCNIHKRLARIGKTKQDGKSKLPFSKQKGTLAPDPSPNDEGPPNREQQFHSNPKNSHSPGPGQLAVGHGEATITKNTAATITACSLFRSLSLSLSPYPYPSLVPFSLVVFL